MTVTLGVMGIVGLRDDGYTGSDGERRPETGISFICIFNKIIYYTVYIIIKYIILPTSD